VGLQTVPLPTCLSATPCAHQFTSHVSEYHRESKLDVGLLNVGLSRTSVWKGVFAAAACL